MPWCMLQYTVKGGIPPTPSGSIVYSLLEAEASFALTPEQVLGYSDLQNEKVRQNRARFCNFQAYSNLLANISICTALITENLCKKCVIL